MDDSGDGGSWYAGGLAFSCRECGDCCRGPGGYVWVTEAEARNLAAALKLDFSAFAAKMLRTTAAGLALIDNPRGDCVLLGEDGRCRVYASRPRQCRSWPWWRENLLSPEHWREAAGRCPGMGRGKPHSLPAITASLASDEVDFPGRPW